MYNNAGIPSTAARWPLPGLLSLCLALAGASLLWVTAPAALASAAQQAQAGTGTSTSTGAGAPHAVRKGTAHRSSAVERRFSPQDARAVKAAVDGYFRAFTQQDWDHLDQYLAAPFVQMGPRPRILATFADVLATWHRIRDPLEGTDYAVSKAVHVTVTALTPNSALADVYWQRVTKAGRVMDDGAEFYFASRQPDGSWRLNGHIGQTLALYKGPR